MNAQRGGGKFQYFISGTTQKKSINLVLGDYATRCRANFTLLCIGPT